ncbi:MAG: diacylglycerol kinase family lipid kinase [Gemmatimonadota bacterium]|jgi:diacylglycerol kinase (ATP)
MPPEPGRTFVLFNPAAGRGRGARRIPRYRELLDRHVPGWQGAATERAGDEARLTDRALAGRFDTIVAVGGDGTWSHVADRILDSGRTDVRFAILPAGTGNDFGRNLSVPGHDLEAAVRNLVEGRTRAIDVGRVLGPISHDEHERPPYEGRHFLNVVGCGFDVAVVDAAKGARILRGALLYKTTAFLQLFRFPGFDVTLEDDDGGQATGHGLMLTISNGRFFGGGFPIAPGATVDDGLLHACFIRDAKPLTRLRLFDRAGKGRHEGERQVEPRTSTAFRLRFPAPTRFEIDGDVYAAATPEVRLEVRPGALRVAAPRST